MTHSRLIPEFKENSKEVVKYCLFLKGIESTYIKLSMGNHDEHRTKVKDVNSELEITLKAMVFLLLYNLVESTTRNAVKYIYECVVSESVSFDKLNSKFQRHIIKFLLRECSENKSSESSDNRNNFLDTNWRQGQGISREIIRFVAARDHSFSGNLDAKKIREILGNYGVTIRRQQGANIRDGIDLQVVKEARKDLAHGLSSFSEKGRNYSIFKRDVNATYSKTGTGKGLAGTVSMTHL
ncbi:MAG: MAE_28990/MAE_18760 family HEPN-like nuclease [Cyanobacteriota bacterium]|jgi:hypothetical protein